MTTPPSPPPPPAPRGVEAMLLAVKARLVEALPKRTLVVPQAVELGDPRLTGVDRYPVLFVQPRATPQLEQTGEPDAYRALYELRVYGFVREQSYDRVRGDRNALAVAVRDALLASPSMGRRLVGPGLAPNSLRESYSDVDTDELGRSVAGFYVEARVAVDEQLAPELPDLGKLVVANVDERLLPRK